MDDDSIRETTTIESNQIKWQHTTALVQGIITNNNNYLTIPIAQPLIQQDFLRSGNNYVTDNTHNGTDIANNDHNWFNSDALLILFVLYAIVIFGGIFGNASLVISICAQKSGRLRKPLLFALCVADLLVVGVSAPLSIVLLSLAYDPWPLQLVGCKAIHYLRVR